MTTFVVEAQAKSYPCRHCHIQPVKALTPQALLTAGKPSVEEAARI
jgi:hypothetical protein